MEGTAKEKPTVLTKDEGKAIICRVLEGLSERHKQNLLENIKAGRRLHCGAKASIFSDENAGCMLTLATTTSLPEHKLDFEKKQIIDDKAMELYRQVVTTYTLNYYIATAMMAEDEFKQLILSSLEAA